ncbi:uncharacterized protein LOC106474743 [Limulus polyphemus]|uniref:Uncharacterized protein LOC106474743 n=1 Tax=Limulus polyphemus TaxID=6850 RepID=A0ABM1BY46_LIMPO|nr:uncharacterized protein LOC106474743 [Limulus polyphemus]XP_022258746.1 uncharacterized protein LOC106474743 [Limulus polyphemus]XP_022258747.1 uncharacterized protein LOC106474743 [Limulus polyphemus]XP_022258748.1 uncharacterized protein LOC106474743 [Limulus polyphemus]XP_022258750.1 uncharacterized protein LOC106474743 [Limulus polyphemus]XP_022258751.1 uncharacterized protein LOC106474743 [Limulus polyphemus]XP_022258752.1 uncharacterized protein LOC106474743 [Limulus polyphemus]
MFVLVMKRRFWALTSLIFIFICGYIYILKRLPVWYKNVGDGWVFNDKHQTNKLPGHCQHPDLDPFHPQVMKYLKDIPKLECNNEEDWLLLSSGRILVNQKIIEKHGHFNCKLTYRVRMNDFENKKGKVVNFMSENSEIPLDSDFFYVSCKAKDGAKWKNLMAGVSRSESAVKRARTKNSAGEFMSLNVLMFGLDSMSRNHFIRKLPKTYTYLTSILKGIVLKGYNIVGDGTPQALIPILTGFTERELPETRKRFSEAQHVNVYPFIWKRFSEFGYVTAFAEDTPETGIFTYRLKGFDEQPTDHYMRSFFLEASKVASHHKKYCLGHKSHHVIMLNWLHQFFDVYPEVPKFAFGFHGEISHDDFNLVGTADDDILGFLKDLHHSSILNNTLLILMSDHGHRFAEIRKSQQGKLEERLPFFSLVLPPWFSTKYPKLYRNLQTNVDRLTTPFDIYSTLMTVLHTSVPLRGSVEKRSISLFSEVPSQRSCGHADIEPHWCTCLSWEDVFVDEPIAKEVAQAVIDFINDYTKNKRHLCAKLSLDKVTVCQQLLPNKALLKFKKSSDKDGFLADLSDNTVVSEATYQVQFHAFPSGGIFEASVKHDIPRGTFHVREQEISRVNLYGPQPHCVQDSYPQLRKYCYCKVQ